jgi:AcrR family transcriptional regulator
MSGDDQHKAARGRPGRSGRPSRGGRPARAAGERSTRDDILGAARHSFAERGYDRATIRDIAARAAVDPALVIHYFRSKEQLFSAALQLPLDPAQVLARVMVCDPPEMGPAVVRTFLEAWEPMESRTPLIAMVRSAMTNDAAMALVREYLGRRVFGPITEALGAGDSQLRATLVGSQFIGLAMMRYVAGIEPLTSASVDELVAAIGPTVQRYLTGDLTGRAIAPAEPEVAEER